MRRHTRALAGFIALATCAALGSTAAAAEPAAHQGLLPAVDREVQFTADGSTTYGTVHVPAHRPGRRLAAALLIPGSGRTDRNGDEPPNLAPGTLARIAETLGEDGVMTLRFDKYTTGRTGYGRLDHDRADLDMDAFTRQAEGAYAALRAQPEANPHALLIVGHSEGALRALLVAPHVHPRPAGLALLAPQDERFLDSLERQLDDSLDQAVAAGAVTPADAVRYRQRIAQVVTDFRAGRPVDTSGLPDKLPEFLDGVLNPQNARFVRTDDAVDPTAAARRIAPGTRVTVTCGTADANIPCPTVPPLLAALTDAGTTGPGLRVLPGVDHFLHPAGAPADGGPLALPATAALHEFSRPWRTR
ncbi:alpha/beta hydrolase [Kitasatospora sp. NPDC097643]|uniref:alpha/beta hydrolase n=1 Tax=Kitasatospora sp. NPDC097643 TaxID=3157230 RepID=UPI003328DA66